MRSILAQICGVVNLPALERVFKTLNDMATLEELFFGAEILHGQNPLGLENVVRVINFSS